jgi:hypothetical protein
VPKSTAFAPHPYTHDRAGLVETGSGPLGPSSLLTAWLENPYQSHFAHGT